MGFHDADIVAESLRGRLEEVQDLVGARRLPVLTQSVYDYFSVRESIGQIGNELRDLLLKEVSPTFAGVLMGEEGGKLYLRLTPTARIQDDSRIRDVILDFRAKDCMKVIPERVADFMKADVAFAKACESFVTLDNARRLSRK